jgi:hypothetical protein
LSAEPPTEADAETTPAPVKTHRRIFTERRVAVWTLVATTFGGVIAVIALILAYLIPTHLDALDSKREALQTCTQSIFALRQDLINLSDGYQLSPYQRQSRLSDWATTSGALDEVPSSCFVAFQTETKLASDFLKYKQQELAEYDVAYQGQWNATTTNSLVIWTGRAIETLTQLTS